MTSYAVAVMISAVSLLAASVRVRRYSRAHVTAQATVAGRGLYVSKTPDGVWWAIRIRQCVCTPTSPWPDGGPPWSSGVREPRRPVGPGPLDAADAIDPHD